MNQPRRTPWLFRKLYPELKLLAGEQERVALLRRLQPRLLGTPRVWLYTLMWSVGLVVICMLVLRMRLPLVPARLQRVVAGLSLSGISLLFTIGLPYLWRKPMRRMIREELKSMGIHICVHCGYSLAGNVSGVCPECGERI